MIKLAGVALLALLLVQLPGKITHVNPSQHEWSEDELSILRSLSLSSLIDLPRSASNKVADLPRAQQFGRDLFFDLSLSANGKVSCATCHDPEKYFTDGLPVAGGIQTLAHNTPTIVGAAWQRWFYWDGRRDSLWAQALTPFEAAEEMGSNRVALLKKIGNDKHYRDIYTEIFGDSSIFTLIKELPGNAGPIGDSIVKNNWHRLATEYQDKINVAFSNIGKAIAAYERTLHPAQTRFDTYVNKVVSGQETDGLIESSELAGLRLFIDDQKTACLQCHNGALLTNREFSNIGTGNFKGERLDFGREFGLQAVLLDEFNCRGRYSDAKPKECSQLRFLNKSDHIALRGAFKVPSLRQLGTTSPYFHDGRFAKLSDVLQHYNVPPTDNGNHELKPMNLTQAQLHDIEAFLQMLNNP